MNTSIQRPVTGAVSHWARDFAAVGAATGAAAPFFVLFDPVFALGAGIAGGGLGLALGAGLGFCVRHLRHHVPLPVMWATVVALGSLWGAGSGFTGGLLSAEFTRYGNDIPLLGFIVGGCAGMVQLAWFFPTYLFSQVRNTLPTASVGLAVLAAPSMGWFGLLALAAATFGAWLFALPAVLWLAVAVDRSQRRVELEQPRGGRPAALGTV